MVNVYKTKTIFKDGLGRAIGINGKIVKIVVKCASLKSPEINLNVRSQDGETLHDSKISKDLETYYPYNIIESTLEGDNVQTRTDHFYINGDLFFKITGMGSEDEIEYVKFYYIDY